MQIAENGHRRFFKYFMSWVSNAAAPTANLKWAKSPCWTRALACTWPFNLMQGPFNPHSYRHFSTLWSLLSCTSLPGHWGQQLPGSTFGLEHDRGGHLFIRHWTFPFCNEHNTDWNEKPALRRPQVINTSGLVMPWCWFFLLCSCMSYMCQ